MGWASRGAPTPAPPVRVVPGARALLEQLAGLDGPAAREAHAALAGALARGQVDAVREAMRVARALVPAGEVVVEALALETPASVLAALTAALDGAALDADTQRVLEAHRAGLANALEARDGRTAQLRAADAARALAAVRRPEVFGTRAPRAAVRSETAPPDGAEDTASSGDKSHRWAP